MKANRRSFVSLLLMGGMAIAGLLGQVVYGRPPQGRGNQGRGNQGRGRRGRGGPGGGPRGGQGDAGHEADHNWIQTLLAGRGQIQRQVKMLPNGIETLTFNLVSALSGQA